MNELLRAHLPPDTPFRYLPETTSTNQEAKLWAREGALHGACVIAARQTAGRGRQGRAFFSPQGGLYMSVILHTQADAGLLTTLAAVAVRRAVQRVTGKSLSIKWVNDLLLDGRKVCGILTEGVLDGARRIAVAGIGVNVYADAFPDEIQDKAGALFAAPPPDGTAAQLAGAIVEELLSGLPHIPAHLSEYRAHCWTLGQRVRFMAGQQEGTGMARSITDTGALVVHTDTGPVLLNTGEAQVRGLDGGYW